MSKNSCLLLSLKLTMGLLVAVWISFWILKPTKAWKKSWHSAEDLANSTFFRDYGLNVVVFCFPILGFAILGFVHMHLIQKERRIRKMTERMGVNFSRPIIVNSPIGILSFGEILFASLFVAFLVWTYYSDVSSDFKKLAPYASLKLNRSQLKVMHMGVRIGSLSEFCLAVLLIPILRGFSLFRVFGIQFEASVRYHIWIANALVLFCTLHGIIIMSIWGHNKRFLKEITSWSKTGRVNVAGAIGLITILIIWITSLPIIRRKYFQTFYMTHHLYIVFISFFLLHAGDRHFYLVLSGVILFSLDKILRLIQSKREICIVSARVLPCKAVELILPKDPSLKYTPTSTIFLKIPSISKLQWHPFSITSSCYKDNENLSVLIKCHGNWTEELYSIIGANKDEELGQLMSLIVQIDGPYGPSHLPYERYSNLVLIAGGSGITPFMSILNEISSKNNTPTKILLIFCVKSLQDLSMLSPISSLFHSNKLENLKLKLFVTREKESSTRAAEILDEKPQCNIPFLDMKNSHGIYIRQEGLIWRAIITALAFVIFIASLIILSNLFVHQVHGKSNRKSSPSWINDLLLFASFVISTSCCAFLTVFFYRRKSKNGQEMVKVPQKDAQVKKSETDKMHGSIIEPEIYFGKRPNLSEALEDFSKETRNENVGVFVCGPESMKASTALFCKNHNTSNFVFNSINFTL
ncbi:hypothetical protein LUZ60_007825 [Juncus effusus]|nr:hypothetical protein LUZ60_007825 [Juncus effusus]